MSDSAASPRADQPPPPRPEDRRPRPKASAATNVGSSGATPNESGASVEASSAAQDRAQGAQRLADGEQAGRGPAEPTTENLAVSHVGSSPDAGTAGSSSPERGLSITRDTGCKVGAHVFVWYSAHGGELPHHPEQRCLCGLVGWEESHATA